jgi:hypothetical protein
MMAALVILATRGPLRRATEFVIVIGRVSHFILILLEGQKLRIRKAPQNDERTASFGLTRRPSERGAVIGASSDEQY